MEVDLELEEKVKALLLEAGRYLTAEDILEKLNINMGRYYLSNRGINLTALSKSLGFIRRPIKKFNIKASTDISKRKLEIETLIKSTISKNGMYISYKFLRDNKIIYQQTIDKYEVDLPSLNAEMGFFKSSPFKQVNDSELEKKILVYLDLQNRYVTQDEISEKFGVSIGFLTKSSIDTVKLNILNGFNPSYSYFELLVIQVLLEIGFSEFKREKTFPECRSIEGNCLRFDIYLPEINVLVEFDGPQHWDKTHPYFSEKLVRNDALKNEFCKSKNIPLIRIPFIGRYKTSKTYIKQKLLETLESLPNYNAVINNKREC